MLWIVNKICLHSETSMTTLSHTTGQHIFFHKSNYNFKLLIGTVGDERMRYFLSALCEYIRESCCIMTLIAKSGSFMKGCSYKTRLV